MKTEMKEKVKIKDYFGSAFFYKRALLIGIPVMLQQLIQNMVSLIDNFMVAGLGDVKMSGVNVAGQMMFVFLVLVNAVCTAGGIFMSQYYGAGDKEGMKQSLRFKVVLGCIGLVLYLIVCWCIPDKMLSLMVIGNKDAKAITEVGVSYIFLMGFIGLPTITSTIIASSLREIGKVTPPLIISVIATCINTFFNWILIYGNLGAPRLEVKGAAYATIIARVSEMLMFIIYICRNKQPFMMKIKDIFKIDIELFKTMLKRGSMVFLGELIWVSSETITTALYNGRGGSDVVSGMASSFAIANLFFVSFGGITTATAVIIGQTLGQGKLDEARKQKTWLLSAAVFFGIAVGLLGLLTTLLVPLVFGNLSVGAQEICREMVAMMSLCMPLWVYINVQFAISRAGGDTVMGFMVDGITTIFIIIPEVFLLAKYTTIGPVWMYMLTKVVDIVKIIWAAWWLKKEKWVKNLAK